jgi:hypothetical protein
MDLPRGDELAQTYRSASDNELLELALAYDSLTEDAQNALRAEFEHRGLEPPVIPDEPPSVEFHKLVTVQQYRDLAEAQVAKGVLDAAGLPCYLRDENALRMQWVWSNLLGGVRLQVNEQDLEAARAVLMQPIPEQIQLDVDIPYDQPIARAAARSISTTRQSMNAPDWLRSSCLYPFRSPNVRGSAKIVERSGAKFRMIARSPIRAPNPVLPSC